MPDLWLSMRVVLVMCYCSHWFTCISSYYIMHVSFILCVRMLSWWLASWLCWYREVSYRLWRGRLLLCCVSWTVGVPRLRCARVQSLTTSQCTIVAVKDAAIIITNMMLLNMTIPLGFSYIPHLQMYFQKNENYELHFHTTSSTHHHQNSDVLC